ncbi:MAG: RNA 2',3'-cyclic phosphodiesterase [Anaerolineaceae bacterium]|nr:RNA 2',3'-cyclic phosphodiesterase [Anaerolineaceae bacterium]
MKRLFIAVPIQEKSRNIIYNAVMVNPAAKRMPVRWTALQNLHLTMQFLGDVEEKRIPELKTILDELSISGAPGSLCFTGLGAFPDHDAPRILWMGIKENKNLRKIQYDLTSELSEKGFNADRKKFKPHLTLGRVRENVHFGAENYVYLEQLVSAAVVPDSPLDRITLFESVLRPGGPIYSVIYEKKL